MNYGTVLKVRFQKENFITNISEIDINLKNKVMRHIDINQYHLSHVRSKFYLFLLLFLLSSCHNVVTNETNNDEKEDQEQSKISWEDHVAKIAKIASQYNASIELDTAFFSFTYQYQDLIDKHDKFIIEGFDFNDVSRTDSNYILFIRLNPSLFAELECTQKQFEEINSLPNQNIKKWKTLNDIFFIVDFTEAKKMKFMIKGHGIKHEDESDLYIDLESSKHVLLKGKLAKIVSNPDMLNE